jgi:predicted GTPase
VASPIDLRRLIEIDKPALRVRYELQEIGEPTLEDALAEID